MMVPLSAADLTALAGRAVDWPVIAWADTRDGEVVAYGGLSWRFGWCDVWLTVTDRRKASARVIVMFARRMLLTAKQMGEAVVYCVRDDEANSAKLLTLVGMKFDRMEEMTFEDRPPETGEIWRWDANPGA